MGTRLVTRPYLFWVRFATGVHGATQNDQKSLRMGSVVPSQVSAACRTWSIRPRVMSFSSMTSRQVAATPGASQ